MECVDNVPFRGGSPHFHKTKLKEGKRLFGQGVGPTLSHVQNKTMLGVIMFGFEVGSKEFYKTKQRNQRAIKLNAWLWGFSLTLNGNKLLIN